MTKRESPRSCLKEVPARQTGAGEPMARGSVESLCASFRTDGFVRVRGRLDAAGVSGAVAYYEVLCERLGLAAGSPLAPAPPGDAYLWGLAASTELAGLAACLLGAPVSCFGVTYINKPPDSGLAASWHQDLGPWRDRLEGAPALTVWLALNDADEANGCLRVIPGSHLLPTYPLRAEEGTSLFGVSIDLALVDEARARCISVESGDVVVHHANLVHGSLPNDSPRQRLALALRYRAAVP